jgi:hypothetical protein
MTKNTTVTKILAHIAIDVQQSAWLPPAGLQCAALRWLDPGKDTMSLAVIPGQLPIQNPTRTRHGANQHAEHSQETEWFAW